jgi:hypothetical protein
MKLPVHLKAYRHPLYKRPAAGIAAVRLPRERVPVAGLISSPGLPPLLLVRIPERATGIFAPFAVLPLIRMRPY